MMKTVKAKSMCAAKRKAPTQYKVSKVLKKATKTDKGVYSLKKKMR